MVQHPREIEDRVLVKKPRALPKVPVSPSATKRRSLSVHNASDKSPTDAVAGDHDPKENVAGLEDNSLHGLLDVFIKGELSTLDPVSSASLDLRDPSTPARKRSYQLQANDLVLSAHETQDGGGDEGVRPPPNSLPASVSRRGEQEDTSVPVAIIPPRSSSLQSPVFSIGSHAISSRQANYPLTPLRLKTGPAAPATPSKRLGAVHRSAASSSEPSLVPTLDESCVCK